ncbi:MAG: hypothetical protein KF884_09015 [Fimbriimonadaceae bacterium]|nr:hypothetical protein [Fimbriimonadaceae bacterium]QYK57690.1 MAG: hypothetical protein KF884_09015 [Fimbriimonadaceae bacterium]
MSEDMCSKCFTMNPDSAEFCSECGAPLKQGSVGSDEEVYADITRANLLRMRGDTKGAHDMCLAVLRRYPNNATAHTLLGDISMDQGDPKHAAEWYEMALDLNPASRSDREKLVKAQNALREIEESAASQHIGLPESRPNPWPMVFFVTGVVLLVAVGAYLAGAAAQGKNGAPNVIREPVAVSRPNYDTATEKPPPKPVETPSSTLSPGLRQDSALVAALAGRMPEGASLTDIASDPRGPSAVLTLAVDPGMDPARMALEAGLAFHRAFPAYKQMSIRVAVGGELTLVADLTADAAVTADSALAGGDTAANLAGVHLSNVWKSGSTQEPATGGD